MRISDWSSDVCSSDVLILSFGSPTASIVKMLCSGRIGNILRIFLSSLGVLLQFKQQLEYPSACNAHTSDIENIPPSIQCWYRSPAVSKALRSVQRIRRQGISRTEERRVGKEGV